MFGEWPEKMLKALDLRQWWKSWWKALSQNASIKLLLRVYQYHQA